MKASIGERDRIWPREKIPRAWDTLETWMRDHVLKVAPSDVKALLAGRLRDNKDDGSHVILYFIIRKFAPGGPSEHKELYERMTNPKACSNPDAAIRAIAEWKEACRRNCELGVEAPPITMVYGALESMFSVVMDKTDEQCRLRWLSLRNNLGLPDRITQETITQVLDFAQKELPEMIIRQSQGLNAGIPMTDNQRKREADLNGLQRIVLLSFKLRKRFG